MRDGGVSRIELIEKNIWWEAKQEGFRAGGGNNEVEGMGGGVLREERERMVVIVVEW